jgi:hypothetical protein
MGKVLSFRPVSCIQDVGFFKLCSQTQFCCFKNVCRTERENFKETGAEAEKIDFAVFVFVVFRAKVKTRGTKMCNLPKYFSEKELQFEKVRYTCR